MDGVQRRLVVVFRGVKHGHTANPAVFLPKCVFFIFGLRKYIDTYIRDVLFLFWVFFFKRVSR